MRRIQFSPKLFFAVIFLAIIGALAWFFWQEQSNQGSLEITGKLEEVLDSKLVVFNPNGDLLDVQFNQETKFTAFSLNQSSSVDAEYLKEFIDQGVNIVAGDFRDRVAGYIDASIVSTDSGGIIVDFRNNLLTLRVLGEDFVLEINGDTNIRSFDDSGNDITVNRDALKAGSMVIIQDEDIVDGKRLAIRIYVLNQNEEGDRQND